ncbi:hypothetical protein PH235_01120 [Trichococcus sp. K1Tr]|uniref:hypothetical protein n=1 Tax=Trichococcus sp. K1Tr TaxID=3020847 RepID=UPI00232B1F7D|nr:hypothetical protein [Trichococcus sp. K1Tr]MDB6352156.1 hypothetical protein [Trichococcus sp. K1Tr]
MANNIISLYRTLNHSTLEKLELSSFETSFYSTEGDDEVPILLENQDDTESYYMGKSDSFWDPNSNDLIVERSFVINNPKALFGIDGVTTNEGKLGIGVHIYSRSSNFQTTIPLTVAITEFSINHLVKFRHVFQPAEIKGEVIFSFFIYLANNIKNIPMFASIPGIRLGELISFKIIVDGDGSIFPVVEVEKSGEPLWNVITNWTDVNSDTFDTDNVRIEINSKHHMYDYIYKSTKPSQYLLVEVLSNAISQIIFQVVNDNDFEMDGEFIPGSIASVVLYWILTFEVNVASLEAINYSLRDKIEPLFM